MSSRPCAGCQKPLLQRDGESPSAFARRKTCGRECAASARSTRGATPASGPAYSSRYGAGLITAAQYLAELMCERIARKEGLAIDPGFWRRPEWKRHHLAQLRHANAVLKLYPAEAVLAALRRPDCSRAYSLGAAWLDPYFVQAKRECERKASTLPAAPVETPVAAPEPPRPSFSRPNLVSKLRGLD